jgi:hypothetical protein
MRAPEAEVPRYWLGVVSREHVALGVAGGFAQLCHGRANPLLRMRAGDWLVYYSPREQMQAGPRLQAFTALGRVADARVYTVAMHDGWVPHRRDVAYERVRTVPLAELKDALHLVARPGWAMQLRRGQVELDRHDFELIAAAMRRA